MSAGIQPFEVQANTTSCLGLSRFLCFTDASETAIDVVLHQCMMDMNKFSHIRVNNLLILNAITQQSSLNPLQLFVLSNNFIHTFVVFTFGW